MAKGLAEDGNRQCLVTKHNNLVEAKYRLSLQEQRLIAFMCAEIKPEDKDFKSYRFVVRDFAELIGLEGQNYYSELKKITRRLISRVITLKEGNKLIQVAWLASAVYHEKEGCVDLRFAPELKPYLLQLKQCFTQYRLGEVLKLRSKYAFRLYELCKKNELLGKYKYEVEELREKLGVEKGQLGAWKDFRKKAIEPAIREVNKKTDLIVSYEAKKLGRRFKWVILKIEKKKEEAPTYEVSKDTPFAELLQLLPEKEREKKTIQNALATAYKKHGFEYCKRNIEYANKKATGNYRVFLIKALQQDWALGWWENEREKEERRRQELEEGRRRREQEEEERRRLEEERRQFEEAAKEFNRLPKEEQKRYFEGVFEEFTYLRKMPQEEAHRIAYTQAVLKYAENRQER